MELRNVATQLVKSGAVAVDRVRPPQNGVVVLIYHRVGGGSGFQFDLPTPLFAEQMRLIAEQQRVATLADALIGLTERRAAAEPPVVVTFDDGTADFHDTALPILQRYRIPATLYLATAFVEEARQFPRGGVPLSWGGLADAVSTGLIDVGSHTHTHALLDRLPERDIARELDQSVELIQDRLGLPARDFAYPKAVAGSATARTAVRQRFRSAALAGTSANIYGRTDPYALSRSPIQAADGMRWFERKLAGGMVMEDRLRSALNRRRYVGLRT